MVHVLQDFLFDPSNVTICDILYRRSVDVLDNTFNSMLLTLLVFFGMLFCLQGFLLVSVSWRTAEKSYSFFEVI